MSAYIDAEVTTLRDSESDDEITLLLGVSDDCNEFAGRVERVGATVETKLGQATLRVKTPEATINRLCELEGLKSIEIEREDVLEPYERAGVSHQR